MRLDCPGPTQVAQLRELWQLAFGDEEAFIDHFFSTAFLPENSRCITEGETVMAALYWFDTELEGQKYAYLYGVATHPAHRGNGLCRRLMADTHKVLQDRGYDAALLMPAEESLRQMYAGMGYRECSRVSEIICAAGKPVCLREVSGEAYALLRQQYLPEGGVIQEGRNLAYLSGFSRFYAGGDFLLAAAKTEETVQGMELLGNQDAAPGIVAALGCSTGTFRIPGEKLLFTMWLPLKERAQRPRYFGLAFD